MNKMQIIRDVVLVVVVIATIYIGVEVYQLNNEVNIVQNGIQEIVNFINNAISKGQ